MAELKVLKSGKEIFIVDFLGMQLTTVLWLFKTGCTQNESKTAK